MKDSRVFIKYLYFVMICLSFCVETFADNISGRINSEITCEDNKVETSNLGQARDQSDIEWCYANAMADFASFYLDMRVSANDIAIKYNHSVRHRPKLIEKVFANKTKIQQGGNQSLAFEIMNSSDTGGFCLESKYWKDIPINQKEDLNTLTMKMYGNLAKQIHSDALADSPQGPFACSQHELNSISGAVRKLRSDMDPAYHMVWNDMTDFACRGKRRRITGDIKSINTDSDNNKVLGIVKLRKQLVKGEFVSISYNAKDISKIKFNIGVMATASFIGNMLPMQVSGLPLIANNVYNKATPLPYASNL